MRWTPDDKTKKGPFLGDIRIIKRFTFFPRTLLICLTGKKETRWLEIVYIEQLFRESGHSDAPAGWYVNGWVKESDYVKYRSGL